MKPNETKLWKRVLAAVVCILMCFTTVYATVGPALAENIVEQTAGDTSYFLQDSNNAAVVFHVTSLPENFDSGVKCQVAYSPSRNYGKPVTLSKLNEWTQAVEIPAGENLYWNCTVVNDFTQDYPVSLSIGSIYKYNEAKSRGDQKGLIPGEVIVVNIDISNVSAFEQMTGENRYYDKEEVIQAPDGVDITQKAQIGVYVSASEGFSDNVIVHLQNLYTGKVYSLKVYSANKMMAMETNATVGPYKYIGCDISSVNGEGRYTAKMEKDNLSAPGDAANFHLIIIDNENPDAEIKTPVLDENKVYQEMIKDEQISDKGISVIPTISEISEVPLEEGHHPLGYVILTALFTTVLAGGYIIIKKIKE